jgi:hypothetical protein
MYFVTLSLLTTVESLLAFILTWIPFYAWIRFFVHLYLVLPGSSLGAAYLYQEHIEPFLYHHEREIDDFITDAHDRARKAGLSAVQRGVEWVKVNVLGLQPSKRRPGAERVEGQTYAQTFMSRFTMPSARGDNLTNLVSQALSGASALYAGNTGAGAESVREASPLVPDSIRNPDDRANYVASQRERLEMLLRAFDREQDNIRSQRDAGTHTPRYTAEPPTRYSPGSTPGGLSKSRSEDQFDRIERDEISSQAGSQTGSQPPPYPITPPAFLDRRTSSGWMPWNWRAGQAQVVQRAVERFEGEDLAYGTATGREREREREYEGRSRTGRTGGFDFEER